MEEAVTTPTLPRYKTRQKYRILTQLSKGSYGDVFLAERLDDGLQVCLKQVDLDFLSPHERLGCLSEVRLLQSLPPHRNVVSCYDAFWDDTSDCGGATRLVLVLEYGDAGDLDSYIQAECLQHRALSVGTALNIFVQIASGLSFLHQQHVLHRDIKSKNIFRFRDGRVVIGDFGTCKSLAHTTALANTLVGSPLYMSPELLDGQPYSFSSDIWSLGCLLYELFAGHTPFTAPSYPAVVFRIMKGTFDPLPSTIPAEIQALATRMLNLDPAQRPTVEDLLISPVLQSHLIDSPEAPTDTISEDNAIVSQSIAADTAAVPDDISSVGSSPKILKFCDEDQALLLPPPAPIPVAKLVVNEGRDTLPPPLPPQPTANPQQKARRTNAAPAPFPTSRASMANILSRERLNLHKERSRQSATASRNSAQFLSCVPVMESGVSPAHSRKHGPQPSGVAARSPATRRQHVPVENILIVGTKVSSVRPTKAEVPRR